MGEASRPRDPFLRNGRAVPGSGEVAPEIAVQIRTETLVIRSLAALASMGAAWLGSASAISPTPVDRALPLIAAIVVVAGWLAVSDRIRDLAALSVPLLPLVAVSVPEPSPRLMTYGAVVMLTLLLVAVDLFRESGDADYGRAAALLVLALVPAHLVPLAPARAPSLVFLIGGALLILWQCARDGRVRPIHLVLAFAVAAVTPIVPFRASLYPLVLAASLGVLRRAEEGARSARTFLYVALALLAAGAAGRWSLPIPGAAVAAVLLAARRGKEEDSGLVTAPWWGGGSMGGVGVLLFAPGLAVSSVARGALRALPFAILLVSSFFVRPFLGTAFLLAGLCFVAADREQKGGPVALRPVPIMLALVFILLFAWSGVVAASFPLPVPAVLLGLLVLAIVVPLAGGRRFWGGALAALAFVLFSWVVPESPASGAGGAGISLKAGESVILPLDRPAKRFHLVATAADVSWRGPGEPLGTIEALGTEGEGWRRSIRVGDIADWGAFRAEQFFFTRNPLPHRPAGGIRGWGREAMLLGHGRILVEVPENVTVVRVSAREELGAGERLIVEGVEPGAD